MARGRLSARNHLQVNHKLQISMYPKFVVIHFRDIGHSVFFNCMPKGNLIFNTICAFGLLGALTIALSPEYKNTLIFYHN